MDRKNLFKIIFNYFLIILGSFILSFGSALFLTKLSIVSGGITGIGIIVQYYLTLAGIDFQVVDIVVWILSTLFLILSFFTVGKRFAFKTLLASIACPLFLTLSLRVIIPFSPFFKEFQDAVSGDGSAIYILLCSLFAGIFVGTGVAVTFIGGGSTGGVDVLIFLAEKYLHLKEGFTSVIIDGSIIIVGLICMRQYISALCGILSAAVAGLMIELIYSRRMNAYQFDIISSFNEEISKYAQEELSRGATVISAVGGYKGENRDILRIVCPKDQYEALRNKIAEIDKSAFVTITTTNAVLGEGFKNHVAGKSIKNIKKK